MAGSDEGGKMVQIVSGRTTVTQEEWDLAVYQAGYINALERARAMLEPKHPCAAYMVDALKDDIR